MLLVDDDRARGRRAARGRPGASRPRRRTLAGPDAPPLVGPLAVAERAVEQRDLAARSCAQPVDERHAPARSPGPARAPAGRPRGERGDGLGVDRGLAAAGHAVEQERRRVAARDRAADRGSTASRLGRAESRRRPAGAPRAPGGRRASGRARSLATSRADEAAPDEPRRRADARARPASSARWPASGVGRRQLGRGAPTWRGPSGRPGGRPPAARRRGRRRPCVGQRQPALVARPGARGRQRPVEVDQALGRQRAQPPEESGPTLRRGQVADRARARGRAGSRIAASVGGDARPLGDRRGGRRAAAPPRARAARACPAAASRG